MYTMHISYIKAGNILHFCVVNKSQEKTFKKLQCISVFVDTVRLTQTDPFVPTHSHKSLSVWGYFTPVLEENR